MDNIYFKTKNLYLVRPSVLTYNALRYKKLEQRIEDMDIAIKANDKYISIFNKNEYLESNDPEFSKYYINVNEEDTILLIKHLFDDGDWTDEKEDFIISLNKYYELEYLKELLEDIKKHDFEDTIKIKKIKK